MENKKGFNFFLIIIALVTGNKLFKHFDFQKFTFEKPFIDTVYLIAFIASVVFITKELIQLKRPAK